MYLHLDSSPWGNATSQMIRLHITNLHEAQALIITQGMAEFINGQ